MRQKPESQPKLDNAQSGLLKTWLQRIGIGALLAIAPACAAQNTQQSAILELTEDEGSETYEANKKNSKLEGIKTAYKKLKITFSKFIKLYNFEIIDGHSSETFIIKYHLKEVVDQPKKEKMPTVRSEGASEIPKNSQKANFICSSANRLKIDGIKNALMELGLNSFKDFNRSYSYIIKKVEGSKCAVYFWKKTKVERKSSIKLNDASRDRIAFLKSLNNMVVKKFKELGKKHKKLGKFTDFTISIQIKLYEEIESEIEAIKEGRKKIAAKIGEVNRDQTLKRKGAKVVREAAEESGILNEPDLEEVIKEWISELEESIRVIDELWPIPK